MALEIRELVIKAQVDEGNRTADTGTEDRSMRNTIEDREELIQACVEQVLQIIKDQEER